MSSTITLAFQAYSVHFPGIYRILDDDTGNFVNMSDGDCFIFAFIVEGSLVRF